MSFLLAFCIDGLNVIIFDLLTGSLTLTLSYINQMHHFLCIFFCNISTISLNMFAPIHQMYTNTFFLSINRYLLAIIQETEIEALWFNIFWMFKKSIFAWQNQKIISFGLLCIASRRVWKFLFLLFVWRFLSLLLRVCRHCLETLVWNTYSNCHAENSSYLFSPFL